MFDSMGAFAKRFKPIEGGYLYYPSKKGGGKLVTAEERDELIEGWRKVAGPTGTWKMVGIVMLAIFLWISISSALSLPDWSDSVSTAVVVAGVCGWIFWASLAPARLVKDRPDSAPPLPVSQAKREARALLNWRFVIFALLFSGAAFLKSLTATERDFASWAWLVGSGTMFSLYVWIAIQKFRER
ncbi:MAG: hypothetical protein J7500_01990 [Sphingomonas sp.]|uniref:hypothetical protein n=1 Tax=Sphingomonas sp. TaxID=28214 RepID=UPI001B139A8E|nr:hypothetical protein [Sphingomonas sp.]MBO9621461.1 hypothetical protein [Sphingomonas sp.]